MRDVPTTPPLYDLDKLKEYVRTVWGAECAARLESRMDALGVDHYQLAATVGVHPHTVSRIQTAAIIPREYLRIAFAGALGCDVADIWPTPDHAKATGALA